MTLQDSVRRLGTSMDMILHCITMMIVTSTFILDAKVFATGEECAESKSTAKVVPACPQTAVEWTAAASKKNCHNIKNNCGSFQYHCVVNAWQNETIEVCSDVKNIVGKVCAEYSFGGRRIQRNGNAKCETCPNVYKSNESYKYSECYHHAYKHRRTVITPILTSEIFTENKVIITTSPTLIDYIQTGPPSESPLTSNTKNNNTENQKLESSPQNAVPLSMGIIGAVVFLLCLVFLVHKTCREKEYCSLKGIFSSLFKTNHKLQTPRHHGTNVEHNDDKHADTRLIEDYILVADTV